jgi:hypothetical protein
MVDSAPLQTSGIDTGLEVLVGPARRVVLDTGFVGKAVDFEGLLVTQMLVRGSDVDLLMSDCHTNAAYLVSVDAAGHAAVADTGPITALLSDGDTVWSVHAVPNGRDFFLYDAAGDKLVWLPQRFEPLAKRGSIVVGRQRSADPQAVPTLSLLDAATGNVRWSYPAVTAVTVGDDAVLFATGPCEGPTPCPLWRLDLATGEAMIKGYFLPSGAGFTDGVLSHDGNRLAFPLSRRQADPRYDLGEGRPADLAVLDLTTGDLSRIGGIELPGTAPAAALTFSPDDTWLVLAVSEGTRTRLLAWRPGLDRALESPASIPGAAAPRPALGLAAKTSAIGP